MTDFVLLSDEPLDVDDARRRVTSPAAGAVSMFIGTTRESFDGRQVVSLSYEAYRPMAEKELKKICKQIRERWDVVNICVVHRLGVVPVQEAGVVMAISSVHRKDSLEAVHYCIDALKASIPIWKQEVYADGAAAWKENVECRWKSHS